MFQYEIRKLFFNKGLLLGIVFLLLFNGATPANTLSLHDALPI